MKGIPVILHDYTIEMFAYMKTLLRKRTENNFKVLTKMDPDDHSDLRPFYRAVQKAHVIRFKNTFPLEGDDLCYALSSPKDRYSFFPKELELDSVPAPLAEKQRKLDPISQSKMLWLIATLWMMILDTDETVLESVPAGTVYPDHRVVKACIRPGIVSQGIHVLAAEVIFVEDYLDFTKVPRNNKHTSSKKPRVN